MNKLVFTVLATTLAVLVVVLVQTNGFSSLRVKTAQTSRPASSHAQYGGSGYGSSGLGGYIGSHYYGGANWGRQEAEPLEHEAAEVAEVEQFSEPSLPPYHPIGDFYRPLTAIQNVPQANTQEVLCQNELAECFGTNYDRCDYEYKHGGNLRDCWVHNFGFCQFTYERCLWESRHGRNAGNTGNTAGTTGAAGTGNTGTGSTGTGSTGTGTTGTGTGTGTGTTGTGTTSGTNQGVTGN
jgi:hypothetical protein